MRLVLAAAQHSHNQTPNPNVITYSYNTSFEKTFKLYQANIMFQMEVLRASDVLLKSTPLKKKHASC